MLQKPPGEGERSVLTVGLRMTVAVPVWSNLNGPSADNSVHNRLDAFQRDGNSIADLSSLGAAPA